MRFVKAILVVLAAVSAGFLSPACAEVSEQAGTRSFFSRDSGRGVFFSSFDASTRDRYIGWGFKYAPKGRLDAPGFRFMTTTGVKLRDIDPTSGIRYNRVDVSRALLGHEWHIAGLSLSAYAGGSFALHSPDTASVLRRRGRVGMAGILEVWQNWRTAQEAPANQSTIENAAYSSGASSATLVVDQATRSLFIRARHGFMLADLGLMFPALAGQIGPEASFNYGATIRTRGLTLQEKWRKARLGIHLSEIPLWRLKLGVSAGGEISHKSKNGAYANIASYIRY